MWHLIRILGVGEAAHERCTLGSTEKDPEALESIVKLGAVDVTAEVHVEVLKEVQGIDSLTFRLLNEAFQALALVLDDCFLHVSGWGWV